MIINVQISTNKPNEQGILMTIDGCVDTTNYHEFEYAMNLLFNENAKAIYLDCSALNYI